MNGNQMNWKVELENMLAAINRETIHSLRVMRLIFKQCGLSFPSDFKQHFLQASCHRIKLTYEQFEMESLLEESMVVNLNSVENVAGESISNGPSWLNFEANDGQNLSSSVDGLDDEHFGMDTLRMDPTANGNSTDAIPNEFKSATILTVNKPLNKLPLAADDLHEIGEPIPYQSNSNGNHTIDPEVNSDSNFIVEMDDSNDSIEMVKNQNDSTDADDDEFNPVNFALNRLNEMTSADRIKDKTMSLKRKKLNKKRIKEMDETNEDRHRLTFKGEKSSPKQWASRSQKRCNVCGYVSSHMGNFNRHMRTHTGEKRFRCDRCGRAFTNTANLLKHSATHVEEIPFHCRACFHGFSLKAEAIAHEKRCKKRHFECHICKKFVTCIKTKLITHMRKHTGAQPFRCEICMQRFSLEHNLKQHLNNIHA